MPASSSEQQEVENTHVSVVNPNIEIAATLPSTPLQLVYQILGFTTETWVFSTSCCSLLLAGIELS